MDKYLAFISYRHMELDQRVSLFLRRKLENYHLPKGCPLPRKRKVFRDTDELPTSSDLGSDIENALKESGYLITLCSEDYPASHWCMREIELFLGMGRRDRILPVLVSGTPETAVPEIIRDVPIAADVRSGSHRDLEAAVQQLLSRMTGMEAEAFAARERRFRLLAGCGAAAAVFAAVLGFAVYAMDTASRIEQGIIQVQKASEDAEAARKEAIVQRNRAMLKNADYKAEKAYTAISRNEQREAVGLALSALPKDLYGDEPVSQAAVGALRLALSLPQYSYQKTNEQLTDFRITGYRAIYSNVLFLTGDPDPGFEMLYDYDTGELSSAAAKSDGRNMLRIAWSEARKRGYSRPWLLVPQTSSDPSRGSGIFYGAEKPMAYHALRNFDTEPDPVLLNGEPFFADNIIQQPLGNCYLAWLEEALPGQERRTALFDGTQAIAELEMAGVPVSADFSLFDYRLAAVDEAGALNVFDTTDGRRLFQVPGVWSYVCFIGGRSKTLQICAVPEDGRSFQIISPKTGSVLMTVSVPSRILSAAASEAKNSLLVLCEDGVRIFSLEDGPALDEIPLAEKPVFAVWGGAPEGLFTDDGNMFVVMFDNRIERYLLAPDLDASLSGAVPLYLRGFTQDIRSILYSEDGNTVYIQDYRNKISAWDARTGGLKWTNDKYIRDQSGTPDGIRLSAEDNAIWRKIPLKGMERINAETGESLYIVGRDTGSVHIPSFSPDGCVGVIVAGSYQDPLLSAFDAETGEELWTEKDYSGSFFFSDDSRELYCYYWKDGTDKPSKEMIYRRLDLETGGVLEEKELFRMEEETDYSPSVYDRIDREAGIILIEGDGYTETGALVYTVWIYDIESGELLRKHTLDVPDADLIYEDGTYAVTWDDPDDPAVSCCRLLDPVTGFGEDVFDNRSEIGRRMMERVRVSFAGEEGYVNYTQRGPGKLHRISDDALLLDADPYREAVTGDEDITMRVEGTLRGGTVCVFGNDTISGQSSIMPLLMLDIDIPTLVQNARQYLEERP